MLEKLRAKPEHTKMVVSLVTTVVIFGCILFIWLSSWDARSQEGDTRSKTVAPLSGLSTMFEGFQLFVSDLISGVPQYVKMNETAPVSTSTAISSSVGSFDLSGVVVIDTASSTATSSSLGSKPVVQ